MKQIWKSYHVFLSGALERWIVYLAYPVLFLLADYWGLVKIDFKSEIYLMMCCSMIVTVETFFDYFVFGGIAAKDTNKLEYLKTSPKGLGILKKSLIGDWMRRFVSVAVIIMANAIISDAEIEWTHLGVCVFSTLLLIELGLIVNRNISLPGVGIAVVVILGMVAMILTGTVLENVLLGVICTVLCLVVSLAGRIFIIQRARRSYYDGRD